MTEPPAVGRSHLDATFVALERLADQIDRIEAWAAELATVLERGGRLLVAGNGGSAAEAQHLSSELVGRYRDERRPLSAIALHADTSSLTAIGNDYGTAEMFSRQLAAHGRSGDVFVALSTSGRSENVLAAARVARPLGVTTWALTGPAPNPLERACDDAVCVDGPTAAAVQEAHLVAVHVLCEGVDVALGVPEPSEVGEGDAA